MAVVAGNAAEFEDVVPEVIEPSVQRINGIAEKIQLEQVDDASKVDIENGKASSPTKERWPLWKLILMALPQLGVQVMWCFVGPNAAPYMVHLGVGPALATLNNVAGPITGFFTGPIVGAWSDRSTSRFGRRRPVIIAGLISTWIAGILFSASEQIFSGSAKIAFAVPMYWVLDVTINVLQTPHRALVADLASEDQQVTMQVVFVFMMAIGNLIGFSIMQIWEVPTEHMLPLMAMICGLNTLCIAVQFLVVREVPLSASSVSGSHSACGPVLSVLRSVCGMPRLLYHLAVVQCFVWIGNTCWNYYGAQWFANAVFQGDEHAAPGSEAKLNFGRGMTAFSQGGQLRSVLQLLSALVIIAIMLKTSIRPRLVYAPCLFIGAIVDFLASFAVGHSAAFAQFCFAVSVMPETGSFAIPFGLVAILNKRAEAEGKPVSTALQMALLNCCVTVGQQVCHVALAAIEGKMSLEKALPLVFILAGVAHALGGSGALCLNDRPSNSEGADSVEI